MVDSPIFLDVEEEVALTLRQHGDGTAFFDYLDERLALRSKYHRYLVDRILDEALIPAPLTVLGSGRFGWAFSMFANGLGSLNVLNFPGNLRHNRLADPGVDPSFKGREFVYVDNSVYKGRTLGQVNDYVQAWGGKIVKAYILYDGSRPPHSWEGLGPDTDYVYRWHEGGFKP